MKLMVLLCAALFSPVSTVEPPPSIFWSSCSCLGVWDGDDPQSGQVLPKAFLYGSYDDSRHINPR